MDQSAYRRPEAAIAHVKNLHHSSQQPQHLQSAPLTDFAGACHNSSPSGNSPGASGGGDEDTDSSWLRAMQEVDRAANIPELQEEAQSRPPEAINTPADAHQHVIEPQNKADPLVLGNAVAPIQHHSPEAQFQEQETYALQPRPSSKEAVRPRERAGQQMQQQQQPGQQQEPGQQPEAHEHQRSRQVQEPRVQTPEPRQQSEPRPLQDHDPQHKKQLHDPVQHSEHDQRHQQQQQSIDKFQTQLDIAQDRATNLAASAHALSNPAPSVPTAANPAIRNPEFAAVDQALPHTHAQHASQQGAHVQDAEPSSQQAQPAAAPAHIAAAPRLVQQQSMPVCYTAVQHVVVVQVPPIRPPPGAGPPIHPAAGAAAADMYKPKPPALNARAYVPPKKQQDPEPEAVEQCVTQHAQHAQSVAVQSTQSSHSHSASGQRAYLSSCAASPGLAGSRRQTVQVPDAAVHGQNARAPRSTPSDPQFAHLTTAQRRVMVREQQKRLSHASSAAQDTFSQPAQQQAPGSKQLQPRPQAAAAPAAAHAAAFSAAAPALTPTATATAPATAAQPPSSGTIPAHSAATSTIQAPKKKLGLYAKARGLSAPKKRGLYAPKTQTAATANAALAPSTRADATYSAAVPASTHTPGFTACTEPRPETQLSAASNHTFASPSPAVNTLQQHASEFESAQQSTSTAPGEVQMPATDVPHPTATIHASMSEPCSVPCNVPGIPTCKLQFGSHKQQPGAHSSLNEPPVQEAVMRGVNQELPDQRPVGSTIEAVDLTLSDDRAPSAAEMKKGAQAGGDQTLDADDGGGPGRQQQALHETKDARRVQYRRQNEERGTSRCEITQKVDFRGDREEAGFIRAARTDVRDCGRSRDVMIADREAAFRETGGFLPSATRDRQIGCSTVLEASRGFSEVGQQEGFMFRNTSETQGGGFEGSLTREPAVVVGGAEDHRRVVKSSRDSRGSRGKRPSSSGRDLNDLNDSRSDHKPRSHSSGDRRGTGGQRGGAGEGPGTGAKSEDDRRHSDDMSVDRENRRRSSDRHRKNPDNREPGGNSRHPPASPEHKYSVEKHQSSRGGVRGRSRDSKGGKDRTDHTDLCNHADRHERHHQKEHPRTHRSSHEYKSSKSSKSKSKDPSSKDRKRRHDRSPTCDPKLQVKCDEHAWHAENSHSKRSRTEPRRSKRDRSESKLAQDENKFCEKSRDVGSPHARGTSTHKSTRTSTHTPSSHKRAEVYPATAGSSRHNRTEIDLKFDHAASDSDRKRTRSSKRKSREPKTVADTSHREVHTGNLENRELRSAPGDAACNMRASSVDRWCPEGSMDGSFEMHAMHDVPERLDASESGEVIDAYENESEQYDQRVDRGRCMSHAEAYSPSKGGSNRGGRVWDMQVVSADPTVGFIHERHHSPRTLGSHGENSRRNSSLSQHRRSNGASGDGRTYSEFPTPHNRTSRRSSRAADAQCMDSMHDHQLPPPPARMPSQPPRRSQPSAQTPATTPKSFHPQQDGKGKSFPTQEKPPKRARVQVVRGVNGKFRVLDTEPARHASVLAAAPGDTHPPHASAADALLSPPALPPRTNPPKTRAADRPSKQLPSADSGKHAPDALPRGSAQARVVSPVATLHRTPAAQRDTQQQQLQKPKRPRVAVVRGSKGKFWIDQTRTPAACAVPAADAPAAAPPAAATAAAAAAAPQQVSLPAPPEPPSVPIAAADATTKPPSSHPPSDSAPSSDPAQAPTDAAPCAPPTSSSPPQGGGTVKPTPSNPPSMHDRRSSCSGRPSAPQNQPKGTKGQPRRAPARVAIVRGSKGKFWIDSKPSSAAAKASDNITSSPATQAKATQQQNEAVHTPVEASNSAASMLKSPMHATHASAGVQGSDEHADPLSADHPSSPPLSTDLPLPPEGGVAPAAATAAAADADLTQIRCNECMHGTHEPATAQAPHEHPDPPFANPPSSPPLPTDQTPAEADTCDTASAADVDAPRTQSNDPMHEPTALQDSSNLVDPPAAAALEDAAPSTQLPLTSDLHTPPDGGGDAAQTAAAAASDADSLQPHSNVAPSKEPPPTAGAPHLPKLACFDGFVPVTNARRFKSSFSADPPPMEQIAHPKPLFSSTKVKSAAIAEVPPDPGSSSADPPCAALESPSADLTTVTTAAAAAAAASANTSEELPQTPPESAPTYMPRQDALPSSGGARTPSQPPQDPPENPTIDQEQPPVHTPPPHPLCLTFKSSSNPYPDIADQHCNVPHDSQIHTENCDLPTSQLEDHQTADLHTEIRTQIHTSTDSPDSKQHASQTVSDHMLSSSKSADVTQSSHQEFTPLLAAHSIPKILDSASHCQPDRDMHVRRLEGHPQATETSHGDAVNLSPRSHRHAEASTLSEPNASHDTRSRPLSHCVEDQKTESRNQDSQHLEALPNDLNCNNAQLHLKIEGSVPLSDSHNMATATQSTPDDVISTPKTLSEDCRVTSQAGVSPAPREAIVRSEAPDSHCEFSPPLQACTPCTTHDTAPAGSFKPRTVGDLSACGNIPESSCSPGSTNPTQCPTPPLHTPTDHPPLLLASSTPSTPRDAHEMQASDPKPLAVPETPQNVQQTTASAATDPRSIPSHSTQAESPVSCLISNSATPEVSPETRSTPEPHKSAPVSTFGILDKCSTKVDEHYALQHLSNAVASQSAALETPATEAAAAALRLYAQESDTARTEGAAGFCSTTPHHSNPYSTLLAPASTTSSAVQLDLHCNPTPDAALLSVSPPTNQRELLTPQSVTSPQAAYKGPQGTPTHVPGPEIDLPVAQTPTFQSPETERFRSPSEAPDGELADASDACRTFLRARGARANTSPPSHDDSLDSPCRTYATESPTLAAKAACCHQKEDHSNCQPAQHELPVAGRKETWSLHNPSPSALTTMQQKTNSGPLNQARIQPPMQQETPEECMAAFLSSCRPFRASNASSERLLCSDSERNSSCSGCCGSEPGQMAGNHIHGDDETVAGGAAEEAAATETMDSMQGGDDTPTPPRGAAAESATETVNTVQGGDDPPLLQNPPGGGVTEATTATLCASQPAVSQKEPLSPSGMSGPLAVTCGAAEVAAEQMVAPPQSLTLLLPPPPPPAGVATSPHPPDAPPPPPREPAAAASPPPPPGATAAATPAAKELPAAPESLSPEVTPPPESLSSPAGVMISAASPPAPGIAAPPKPLSMPPHHDFPTFFSPGAAQAAPVAAQAAPVAASLEQGAMAAAPAPEKASASLETAADTTGAAAIMVDVPIPLTLPPPLPPPPEVIAVSEAVAGGASAPQANPENGGATVPLCGAEERSGGEQGADVQRGTVWPQEPLVSGALVATGPSPVDTTAAAAAAAALAGSGSPPSEPAGLTAEAAAVVVAVGTDSSPPVAAAAAAAAAAVGPSPPSRIGTPADAAVVVAGDPTSSTLPAAAPAAAAVATSTLPLAAAESQTKVAAAAAAVAASARDSTRTLVIPEDGEATSPLCGEASAPNTCTSLLLTGPSQELYTAAAAERAVATDNLLSDDPTSFRRKALGCMVVVPSAQNVTERVSNPAGASATCVDAMHHTARDKQRCRDIGPPRQGEGQGTDALRFFAGTTSTEGAEKRCTKKDKSGAGNGGYFLKGFKRLRIVTKTVKAAASRAAVRSVRENDQTAGLSSGSSKGLEGAYGVVREPVGAYLDEPSDLRCGLGGGCSGSSGGGLGTGNCHRTAKGSGAVEHAVAAIAAAATQAVGTTPTPSAVATSECAGRPCSAPLCAPQPKAAKSSLEASGKVDERGAVVGVPATGTWVRIDDCWRVHPHHRRNTCVAVMGASAHSRSSGGGGSGGCAAAAPAAAAAAASAAAAAAAAAAATTATPAQPAASLQAPVSLSSLIHHKAFSIEENPFSTVLQHPLTAAEEERSCKLTDILSRIAGSSDDPTRNSVKCWQCKQHFRDVDTFLHSFTGTSSDVNNQALCPESSRMASNGFGGGLQVHSCATCLLSLQLLKRFTASKGCDLSREELFCILSNLEAICPAETYLCNLFSHAHFGAATVHRRCFFCSLAASDSHPGPAVTTGVQVPHPRAPSEHSVILRGRNSAFFVLCIRCLLGFLESWFDKASVQKPRPAVSTLVRRGVPPCVGSRQLPDLYKKVPETLSEVPGGSRKVPGASRQWETLGSLLGHLPQFAAPQQGPGHCADKGDAPRASLPVSRAHKNADSCAAFLERVACAAKMILARGTARPARPARTAQDHTAMRSAVPTQECVEPCNVSTGSGISGEKNPSSALKPQSFSHLMDVGQYVRGKRRDATQRWQAQEVLTACQGDGQAHSEGRRIAPFILPGSSDSLPRGAAHPELPPQQSSHLNSQWVKSQRVNLQPILPHLQSTQQHANPTGIYNKNVGESASLTAYRAYQAYQAYQMYQAYQAQVPSLRMTQNTVSNVMGPLLFGTAAYTLLSCGGRSCRGSRGRSDPSHYVEDQFVQTLSSSQGSTAAPPGPLLTASPGALAAGLVIGPHVTSEAGKPLAFLRVSSPRPARSHSSGGVLPPDTVWGAPAALQVPPVTSLQAPRTQLFNRPFSAASERGIGTVRGTAGGVRVCPPPVAPGLPCLTPHARRAHTPSQALNQAVEDAPIPLCAPKEGGTRAHAPGVADPYEGAAWTHALVDFQNIPQQEASGSEAPTSCLNAGTELLTSAQKPFTCSAEAHVDAIEGSNKPTRSKVSTSPQDGGTPLVAKACHQTTDNAHQMQMIIAGDAGRAHADRTDRARGAAPKSFIASNIDATYHQENRETLTHTHSDTHPLQASLDTSALRTREKALSLLPNPGCAVEQETSLSAGDTKPETDCEGAETCSKRPDSEATEAILVRHRAAEQACKALEGLWAALHG